MAKVSPIEIQKHLKGIDYPVSKQDLLEHAQKGAQIKQSAQYSNNYPMRNTRLLLK